LNFYVHGCVTHHLEEALVNADPLHLAVIIGSTRQGRRGHIVAEWAVGQIAERDGFTVDLIDLADAALPAVFPMEADERLTAYRRRLDEADAFVVVTPEYNHSAPASLKHAIDLAGAEWRRKPVAFVSYGGLSGGLRAVEHLRQVFAELHAVGVRDTVSFHGPWNGFTDDGQPSEPTSAAQGMTVLLDDLAWWGTALRAARHADLLQTANW